MQFTTEHGLHRLEDVARGLRGVYLRSEAGVCIVAVESVVDGQGHFRAFLDALPHDVHVEFDNVVNPIVANALERRGFTFRDDGSNSWVRRAV